MQTCASHLKFEPRGSSLNSHPRPAPKLRRTRLRVPPSHSRRACRRIAAGGGHHRRRDHHRVAVAHVVRVVRQLSWGAFVGSVILARSYEISYADFPDGNIYSPFPLIFAFSALASSVITFGAALLWPNQQRLWLLANYDPCTTSSASSSSRSSWQV